MTEQDKSLKTQAEEIMVRVDQDVQAVEQAPPETKEAAEVATGGIVDRLFGIISDVDIEAAEERVAVMRDKYPDLTPEELAQRLIKDKCQKTGAIGAVTSGAGLIPGIGTAAAMTLGVAADIGATFKLQAELVLEIAAVYEYPLTEDEKQRIVMVITGLSFGTTSAARRAGEMAALKLGQNLGERAVGKAFIKSLPVIGVIASAGTNVLSTYIIGQRADAYFRLGPEAVGTWTESLRTISGVDERKVGSWLAETGSSAGAMIASGASTVGEYGAAAGSAAVSGAQTAGGAVFGLLWKVVSFIWAVMTFIPRKIIGLFRRGK